MLFLGLEKEAGKLNTKSLGVIILEMWNENCCYYLYLKNTKYLVKRKKDRFSRKMVIEKLVSSLYVNVC